MLRQTTVGRRICFHRCCRDRTKIRHIDIGHILKSALIRQLVNGHSSLTQLIHRFTGRSLLRRIPLERGTIWYSKAIRLRPTLKVCKRGNHNARRTHTGARRRILHHRQRRRVHRSDERKTHTKEQHTDHKLLQATQRTTLLPHQRREDEHSNKQRNKHSPRQVHKRLIPPTEPCIETLHPFGHTLTAGHAISHFHARRRDSREEQLKRVEGFENPDDSRENSVNTTGEHVQQRHNGPKQHVLEMESQTSRRGIKTQRIQQRAILRICENTAIHRVCTTRPIITNL